MVCEGFHGSSMVLAAFASNQDHGFCDAVSHATLGLWISQNIMQKRVLVLAFSNS